MSPFKKIMDLLRIMWRRIVAHYRRGDVQHRKDDFYSSFAASGAGKLALPPEEAQRRSRTSRWISLMVLLAIVAATGFLFYRVMVTFFVPLFLALLFTVIFRPLFRWISDQIGGHRKISAGITTGLVLVIVLVPLAWASAVAVRDAVQLVSELNIQDVEQRLQQLRETLGLKMEPIQTLGQVDTILTELLHPESAVTVEAQHAELEDARRQLQELRGELNETALSRVEGKLSSLEMAIQTSPETMVPDSQLQNALIYVEQIKQSLAGNPLNVWMMQMANPSEEKVRLWRQQGLDFGRENFLSATGATTEFIFKLVLGAIIMVVSLYFFLADGPTLLQVLMALLPLQDSHERELLLEFDRVSRAVVVATILSALVQAVLAGLGFWIVGIEAVFLLMLLTFVFSLVPFVGAAAVWLPTAAYLWFYDDRFSAAMFLLLYGTLVVSLSDNVVKPLVLHGQSKIHPLLALLSILGGVQALGPVGIFVGPMVVAFLQTLLNLLHREMVALEAAEAEHDRNRRMTEGGQAEL